MVVDAHVIGSALDAASEGLIGAFEGHGSWDGSHRVEDRALPSNRWGA